MLRETSRRIMRVPNRLALAIAFSAAAFLSTFGAAIAQSSPPTYQGCEVGTLVTLRQEVSNDSGVTVAVDYVTLRCDGWNWVPANW
jgi:hypothetical protein